MKTMLAFCAIGLSLGDGRWMRLFGVAAMIECIIGGGERCTRKIRDFDCRM